MPKKGRFDFTKKNKRSGKIENVGYLDLEQDEEQSRCSLYFYGDIVSATWESMYAKKLDVTRSSVNAWEMGLSTPTTQYVAAMAQLFHVSSDYMLGIENRIQITLDGYSQEETKLIFNLLKYFDEHR